MQYLVIPVLLFSLPLAKPVLWIAALCAGCLLLWGIWRCWLWLGPHYLHRQLDRQLSPGVIGEVMRYYQSVSFGTSRPDFPGFVPAEMDIVDYFRQSVFAVSPPIHNHYLILGAPGAGKTTVLVRLWLRMRLAALRGGWRTRLFRLNDPRIFEKLEEIHTDRDKTILLLDGLDDLLRSGESYKSQADLLLDQLQGFARVVITCRTGALPFSLEAGNREGLIEYIGERHFQVFARLFLAPVDPDSALRFIRNRLPVWARQRRRAAREMIREMPDLMSNPLLLRLVLSLRAGKRRFRFKYELLETYLLSWISSQSPTALGAEYPRRMWDFLMDVSLTLIGMSPETPGTVLTADTLAAKATRYGLVWHKLRIDEVLSPDREGHFHFRHPYLHAPLIAYAVFNENFPAEALDRLPEAAELFREHAWEKYMRECGNKGPHIRTRALPEKRPSKVMRLQDLPLITRLYLPVVVGCELRFISYMKELEAIWLEDDASTDPAALLPFLPHEKVRIYRQTLTGAVAYEPVQTALAPMKSVKNLDPEGIHPFRQPINRQNKTGSKALLSLFTWDLTALPDHHCRLRTTEGDRQVYESFPGTNEMNLFDKAWVCKLPGDEIHVMFEYLHTPTLLLQGLEEMVKKLVRIYGEDDAHLADFTDTDRADVEDGFWTGRKWFWGNTDRYAYPVHLYMTAPGQVKLVVYGLPVSRVKEESMEAF